MVCHRKRLRKLEHTDGVGVGRGNFAGVESRIMERCVGWTIEARYKAEGVRAKACTPMSASATNYFRPKGKTSGEMTYHKTNQCSRYRSELGPALRNAPALLLGQARRRWWCF
jgi:hypothetical protein